MLFQHANNLKIELFHTFFILKSWKPSGYFILIPHCNSDWPHGKCLNAALDSVDLETGNSVWSLDQWYGQHGHWLEMQSPRPHPRPTESESACLQDPCMICMCIKVQDGHSVILPSHQAFHHYLIKSLESWEAICSELSGTEPRNLSDTILSFFFLIPLHC